MGWGAKCGLKHPFGPKEQCCAFNMWHELRIYKGGQDCHEEQPMQSPRTMNACYWFNSIGKKPFVKANLAIYCLVLGVCG